MRNIRSSLISLFALCALATVAVRAEEAEDRHIVVEAEELPSAYGAPPDLSHGRISTLTKSYVLAPFTIEVENSYVGRAFRHGLPAHAFKEEIELGLPARFTVGIQNEVERFAGSTREGRFTVEGRYALASWGKLPLNPAISTEYRFGVGRHHGDAAEFALLVSRDLGHEIEWALNVFLEQEVRGKRATNGGFAQSAEIPVLLPDERLEAGVEMQYRSGGEAAGGGRSAKGLAIGPTLAWRPSQRARLDLSPLFGCSRHAAAVEVFAVFSLSFGHTSEAGETESPASARAR